MKSARLRPDGCIVKPSSLDAMTKHVPGSSLISCLQNGTWTLVHDPKFVSAKKLKRMKTQVMAEEFGVSKSMVVLEADPPSHAYLIQR